MADKQFFPPTLQPFTPSHPHLMQLIIVQKTNILAAPHYYHEVCCPNVFLTISVTKHPFFLDNIWTNIKGDMCGMEEYYCRGCNTKEILNAEIKLYQSQLHYTLLLKGTKLSSFNIKTNCFI